MSDATYEPYNPGTTAVECGCGLARCSCKPCGSCPGCTTDERCERCACGVSAAGSDTAPAGDPTPVAQSWPLLDDAATDNVDDQPTSSQRTSTQRTYASRYRSRTHSTWSSTASTVGPGRGRRGIAAGASCIAACGGVVTAANNAHEPEPTYDQCVTEFLAEHPRRGTTYDPYNDPASSSYLGGYSSYDTYDFGLEYEGSLYTPEEACDHLLK